MRIFLGYKACSGLTKGDKQQEKLETPDLDGFDYVFKAFLLSIWPMQYITLPLNFIAKAILFNVSSALNLFISLHYPHILLFNT